MSGVVAAVGNGARMLTYGEPIEPDEKRGLYLKFHVERLDGSSEPGGKHYECDYFVLDWEHDKYAVIAARAYASACEREFPELAKSLRERADRAEEDARTR